MLNCIVLWNTVYINASLGQLRAAGYPVLDQDTIRLHPFIRRHIAVQGDYSFLLPALDGQLRALRDPTEGQHDDASYAPRFGVPNAVIAADDIREYGGILNYEIPPRAASRRGPADAEHRLKGSLSRCAPGAPRARET